MPGRAGGEAFRRLAPPVRHQRGCGAPGQQDLEAPKANSLVPSVNVVVVNDAGDILLIRRSDNENWAVPGGHRPR